jgi:arylsulfatase A-like enzyme
LVLFGGGIKPGRYDQAVTPADIAPTLARICGVPLPTATGRVLEEALASPATSH